MTARHLPRKPFAQYALEAGRDLDGARLLPLTLIDANPQQSRQVFDAGALDELAASIKEHGVLEPILVRPLGDRYQVVAGERRTRAARLAGLTDIPALVRDLTDTQAAYTTAIENLQREDLDLEDEARWLAFLQEQEGLSDRALADRLGKNKSWVNRRLWLLREHPERFAAIRAGTYTLREALAPAPNPPPPPSYDTGSQVSHGETRRPSDSTPAPDPPMPRPTERAALDQATGTGDTRLVAYRRRAFDAAATTLLRTDWANVPAEDRAAVRETLALIEAALDEAHTVLDAQ